MEHRKPPLLDVLTEHLGRPLTPSEKAILELAQVVLGNECEEESDHHKGASAGK